MHKKKPPKPRVKKLGGSSALRVLTKLEKTFVEEMQSFDKVLDATLLISVNQHGINADGRGSRAARIFTRQTVIGLSLNKVLPRPNPMKPHDGELWDIAAIAALSRNLLEGFLSLHFFGTEKVSPEEGELRFFILQLHRNVEWYETRKLFNPNDPGLKDFEDNLPSERDRIKNHPYLSSLSAVHRARALKGNEIYKTKGEFESELPVCKNLRANYRLLSNFVHPLPFSIERMDNERGRGLGSDPDVNLCILSLIIARSYLAASTVAIADHFADELASKFATQIDSIRSLTSTI